MKSDEETWDTSPPSNQETRCCAGCDVITQLRWTRDTIVVFFCAMSARFTVDGSKLAALHQSAVALMIAIFDLQFVKTPNNASYFRWRRKCHQCCASINISIKTTGTFLTLKSSVLNYRSAIYRQTCGTAGTHVKLEDSMFWLVSLEAPAVCGPTSRCCS